MSTPRDTQLLAVGHQCSESSCHLVDFLPFKCQHCNQAFCGEHFKANAHRCPKYDESKFNRVAPSCPLCHDPVAIPQGQDPNIRMEKHFATECSVMTGKTKSKSSPVCAKGKCGKVLFAPIRCNKCMQDYCPQHRFPADHSCLSSASTSKADVSKPSNNVPTKASTAAAMAAVKRGMTSPSSAATAKRPTAIAASSSSSSTSKAPAAHSNPFSKTDRHPYLTTLNAPNNNTETADNSNSPSTDPKLSRPEPAFDPMRAKAERESRRRAMMERAKKGLLSEEEKVMLATEEAERAQQDTEGKRDCIVM